MMEPGAVFYVLALLAALLMGVAVGVVLTIWIMSG